jgi:hypothetical protein
LLVPSIVREEDSLQVSQDLGGMWEGEVQQSQAQPPRRKRRRCRVSRVKIQPVSVQSPRVQSRKSGEQSGHSGLPEDKQADNDENEEWDWSDEEMAVAFIRMLAGHGLRGGIYER